MLKKLFLFVVILIAAAIGVAFALPRHVSVERNVTIDAPAARIYPFLANLKTWPDWTVFEKDLKNVDNTFGGAASGPGATWAWKTSAGNGTLQIDAGSPEKGIDYTMQFEGMHPAKGTIHLAPAGQGTSVTWKDDFDLGNNPVMRWMGLMMGGVVGKLFEQNLANLKTKVEGGAAPVEASGKK